MDVRAAALAVCLMLAALLTQPCTANTACCSFPCQHAGVCVTHGRDSYTCDCDDTGHSGRHCETPSWWTWLRFTLKPDLETQHYLLTHYKWLWDVINSIYAIRGAIMRMVYLVRAEMVDSPALHESYHAYTTWDAVGNISVYQRALPPVPDHCPRPLGTVGPAVLPDVDQLVDRLFVRKSFLPETYGSNMLFAFFAQHFSHMFFKTTLKVGSGGLTWGGHGVDMTTVYGPDKKSELSLRAMQGGRLKTSVQHGEEWPPLVSQSPDVKMIYPKHVPPEQRYAIGHEFFGLLPGLMVYATVWIREHNRVAALLQQDHPTWDDEQLFQTAKLVLLGETIKIVVEDYVQHLSRYHYQLVFDPELLFGYPFQYQNRITVEFNHLYHWHPLMPDSFNVSGRMYGVNEYVFNNQLATKTGLRGMVESLVAQKAGKVTLHNHAPMTIKVAKETILHGRDLRFQSFNNYRRRFRLPAYKSFYELTGDADSAAVLEQLYGDVEAVEFYVGIIAEKHRPQALFGSTVVEMGGPFSVKGLMSNPICSPKFWRPSTFGGARFFDIVKTASLQKLFCDNMAGPCPAVTFTSTNHVTQEDGTRTTRSQKCVNSQYCSSINDFVEL